MHGLPGNDLLKMGLLAVAYVLTAVFGIAVAHGDSGPVPPWPATGVAMAAILIWGYRVWPGVLAGSFLVGLFLLLDKNASLGSTLLASPVICFGSTAEAVLGPFLLNRSTGSRDPLSRAHSVIRLIVLSALLATTVGAASWAAGLVLAGVAGWDSFFTLWFTWWIADAVGVLIVTPVLVAWFTGDRVNWRSRMLFDTALIFGLLAGVSWLAFSSQSLMSSLSIYRLEYLVIPIVVWATFRFRQRGTTAAMLIASTIAVWCTLHGKGPFAQISPDNALLFLQIYLAAVALTGLTLAAVLTEGERAQVELQSHRDHLEELVDARTLELRETNEQLEREIAERKCAQAEREKLIEDLQDALNHVKTLSGMLPICASCKKVRDDKGYWNQIEVYITEHSEADFSHSICPDCAQKLYPGVYKARS